MLPFRRLPPCAFALLLVGACYGPELAGTGGPGPAVVRLSDDSASVNLSEELQLSAVRTDSSGADLPATLYWSSGDRTIATVTADGRVRGKAPGSTWIFVSDSRNADSLRLDVTVEFQSVSAGMDVSCGTAGNGEVLCWGWNGVGAIGIGVGSDTGQPVLVTAERSSNLVVGAGSVCSLRASQLWCWGYNGVGQLADGTTANRTQPVAVADTLSLRQVVLGAGATVCALDGLDHLLCWGWNGYGQLLSGGPSLNSRRPILMHTPAPTVAVATGGGHVCTLDDQGAAWCWGRNDYGQLGDGDLLPSYAPVRVAGVPPLTNIVAGLTHTCGRTAAGQAWCWGSNEYGQLGVPGTDHSTVPVLAAQGQAFEQLSTSWNHTCGVSSGTALCWGANIEGQLGSGDQASGPGARVVQGGLTFRTVSAGVNHTCGLTTGGKAFCWGGNTHGSLGDGRRVDQAAPVEVLFQR